MSTLAELIERRNVAITRLLKLLETEPRREQYEILTGHLGLIALEKLADDITSQQRRRP